MAKKIKLLPNGRSASAGNGFSLVTVEMQGHPAFQDLAASSHRVLLWFLWKNYKCATNQPKGATGKPVFQFTNAEAQEKLNMNQQTFSRAKKELDEKGFIRWEVRGGLKGVNGVASEFSLSGDWKNWVPLVKTSKENSIPHGKNLKSVTPT